MSPTKISIVLPTWNRSALLAKALGSILEQDYPDFDVVVVDNASSDDTMDLLASVRDPRLSYHRNATNLGLVGNFNKALSYNRSPYVTLFNDDDLMQPGFLRTLATALDEHPSAGLAFCLNQLIDANGTPRGAHDGRWMGPGGLIRSADFLRLTIAGRAVMIVPSSSMMRASVLRGAGNFQSPHSSNTIDLNLYVRLATQADVVYVPQHLTQYRIHEQQYSSTNHARVYYAQMAERIDALGYFLRSDRCADPGLRAWLADQLLKMHLRQSSAVARTADSYETEVAQVKAEIEQVVPAGATVILVDDDTWGCGGELAGRRALPMREVDGQYYGPPADDDDAIGELERQVAAGAEYILFIFGTFWWLDHYADFNDHLTKHYRCVCNTTSLIAFDLRRNLAVAAAAHEADQVPAELLAGGAADHYSYGVAGGHAY